MTRLAIDNLVAPDHSLEEILDSPTIVPKRIGFCAHMVARDQWCGRAIYDDDHEAFETGVKKRICGQCVETLLTLPVTSIRVYESSEPPDPVKTRVRNFRRRPSKEERML